MGPVGLDLSDGQFVFSAASLRELERSPHQDVGVNRKPKLRLNCVHCGLHHQRLAHGISPRLSKIHDDINVLLNLDLLATVWNHAYIRPHA